MTLEEAKRTAPPVRFFGQTQYIIGTPDNCRISGNWIERDQILSWRCFAPTNYANGQMSDWVDTNKSISESEE